jgi:hypothetical protein
MLDPGDGRAGRKNDTSLTNHERLKKVREET